MDVEYAILLRETIDQIEEREDDSDYHNGEIDGLLIALRLISDK